MHKTPEYYSTEELQSLSKHPEIMPSELDPLRQHLRRKAKAWRTAERVGLLLHRLAPPTPIAPSAVLTLPTSISPFPGNITIQFYTPSSYDLQKTAQTKFPVVINFHGGGFTLGSGAEDCRWATAVVQQIDAVVASVDYRLAPEYPFPTAVEDGVDAILWLVEHAEELAIDPHRIALSGFSAGGNLCFTVLLRLHEELQGRRKNNALSALRQRSSPSLTYLPLQNSSSLTVPTSQIQRGRSVSDLVKQRNKKEHSFSSVIRPRRKSLVLPALTSIDYPAPTLSIVGLVAWYPPVDYRQSRDKRSATNLRPGAGLPKFLTRLFDESYLHTPLCVNSPFCSPAAATDDELRSSLPNNIMIYTCEYDDLRQEAQDFSDRLRDCVGRKVSYTMIRGVPHGWDKSPNPLWPPRQVSKLYEAATAELQEWFRDRDRMTEVLE